MLYSFSRSAAFRELLGWILAGLLNAPWVAMHGAGSRLSARLFLQVLDLSQFVLLGALAAGAALLPVRRLPGAASVALGWAALTLVFAFALREDLENVAARLTLPALLLRGLVGGAAAALCLLLRRTTQRLEGRVLPWLGLAATGLFAFANYAFVPRDYPGVHLLVAACTATVATLAFGPPWQPTDGAHRHVGTAALTLVPLGALGLFVPIDAPAWKRLLLVPSSAATPFFVSARATRGAGGNRWLERRYPEWFPVARAPQRPTHDVDFPKNGIVLLLTVDALRADVVASGKHDAELPELAKLRDTSVWFTRARSPSPSTLATIASIFSGRFYSGLYWTKDAGDVLPRLDTSVRLPQLLAQAGVRTVQTVPMRALSVETGVTRGFEIEVITRRHYGHADEVMDQLLAQVEKLGDQPAFLFAHFIDPHAPYTLGGKRNSPYEAYLAEVARVDEQLGRLRAHLAQRGLDQRAALIVSADHGEAFGEHGRTFHSTTVYDELLRVPLFLKLPQLPARRVDEPVTLIDLGPTILDLFDQPTPAEFLGQSLCPLLSGQGFEANRPIAADSGRRVQALLFPDGFKAIRDLVHHTHEVYDLERDPTESEDLSATADPRARHYLAGLEHFFEAHTLQRPGWEPPWRKF